MPPGRRCDSAGPGHAGGSAARCRSAACVEGHSGKTQMIGGLFGGEIGTGPARDPRALPGIVIGIIIGKGCRGLVMLHDPAPSSCCLGGESRRASNADGSRASFAGGSQSGGRLRPSHDICLQRSFMPKSDAPRRLRRGLFIQSLGFQMMAKVSSSSCPAARPRLA
jgi:hypothetical protein